MNAYLIYLMEIERNKREKLYKMQQIEKAKQIEKTKQMNRNINGPDDVNYSMARALDKADVDMYDLIHSIKRNFWN